MTWVDVEIRKLTLKNESKKVDDNEVGGENDHDDNQTNNRIQK